MFIYLLLFIRNSHTYNTIQDLRVKLLYIYKKVYLQSLFVATHQNLFKRKLLKNNIHLKIYKYKYIKNLVYNFIKKDKMILIFC